MTIEKGRPWGGRGPAPEGAVAVRTDAEARALLEAADSRGDALPTLILLGGDLARALGGRGDLDRIREDAALVTVDIGEVELDGGRHLFVAHLVARRSWWWGPITGVLNAQHIGPWDVAPRAHPGDGRLDLIEVRLGLGDRLKARGRLAMGTHVPHPDITERRVRQHEATFARPTPIWLDGERVGSTRSLRVTVRPDVLQVAV